MPQKSLWACVRLYSTLMWLESQIAVNNIGMVDGLGLDLFTEVIDWEEMKDLQRAFFPRPTY